ncbi:hypothetical protein NGB36_08755 [Streptomyces sp. RB6PN25]|uniref:Uncharacterized protein n=1 Tax=Streptomyces humicola TaxID=2953240 RepID=A0ABT1PSN6_9ACTN|nr:hypothetical protein [Streptomyces humicola]MCQ4080689.1 hypothetical protein [Streptomyces humicola]
MEEKKPRSAAVRWLSPGEDSSATQLRWTVGLWSALTALWISWQFWGDGSAPRRGLIALLTVISLIQALGALGLLRKKRGATPRRR